jgi:Tol biopolymer transport system component
MPLTSNGLRNNSPDWTPDGKHIVFLQQAGAENAIWWIRSDGSGQLQKLFASKDTISGLSISPDGRHIAFSQLDASTRYDLWTLSLDLSDPDQPKPGAPELFLKEPDDQRNPVFSPDGRWIAYESWVSSRMEILVRPFPGSSSGGKWQVSINGGNCAVWSRGGKELWFVGPR